MRGIEHINAVGRKLAKGGIFLCYHNHAQEFRRFPNGKRGMDVLFDNMDTTGAHFLLDTHWVQAGGADIIEWIQKCKGRLQYLHMKDYRIGPVNYTTIIEHVEKEFAEVGDGNLPWQLIVDTGLAVGVKAFIVEQDFNYGADPFENCAKSYKTLKACGLN
jgi:sugar phosphate isomerase/epimerase